MLFLLCVAVLALITKWLLRKQMTAAEYLEKLEAQDLVQADHYRAKRAFQITSWANEGPHYFIELADGSVLYLNGDKLYDYEPMRDDPELNQARQFPCTEFTVRKHRTRNFLLELICAGEVLEPEIIHQLQHRKEYLSLIDLKLNSILPNYTYDQIKAERLRRSKEQNQ